MIASPFLSALRLVAAILVACTLLIAPAVEAQHVDAAPTAACDVGHDASETGGEDTGDHDHHAHKCGSCHIHLLRKETSADHLFVSAAQSLRPPLSQNLSSLPPGSLYRPPRA